MASSSTQNRPGLTGVDQQYETRRSDFSVVIPAVRLSSCRNPGESGRAMYFNVFGEKVSRARYREMLNAAKNRRELIAAGLTSRRDLMKMGLLTAGGLLVAKSGLSARAYGQTQTNNPPSSGSNTSPGTNQNCVPGNQTQSPR